MPWTLAQLNASDPETFVTVCGPFYEHSPWVARRVAAARPFASRASLHEALQAAVLGATIEEQLQLIRAHPDLVGRAARAGRLTAASAGEQAAAGLGDLGPDEVAAFERYNAAYRERFGFPFVICARENRKEAILAAFPVRLAHSAAAERSAALAEIGRIAWLRLCDAVAEDSLP
jgi:2-oxo-4-hydroxy-4-carboxy-5-ureidoimidazoline decarboxylase